MTEPWAGKFGQPFFDWWDTATDDERRDYLRHIPEWERDQQSHLPWRSMTVGIIRRTFPTATVPDTSLDNDEFVRMYNAAKEQNTP